MLYPRLAVTLLVAASSLMLAVQDDSKYAEALALKPASVDLSSGADAWAVRVVQTGGFAGTMLDVTVTSEGKLKCVSSVQKSCMDSVSPAVLESARQLATVKTIVERKSTLNSSCRDCFVTRITLKRRESEGKVKTYFSYWDDLTVISAPFDLVRLANSVVSLAQ